MQMTQNDSTNNSKHYGTSTKTTHSNHHSIRQGTHCIITGRVTGCLLTQGLDVIISTLGLSLGTDRRLDGSSAVGGVHEVTHNQILVTGAKANLAHDDELWWHGSVASNFAKPWLQAAKVGSGCVQVRLATEVHRLKQINGCILAWHKLHIYSIAQGPPTPVAMRASLTEVMMIGVGQEAGLDATAP